jgi:UDP-N-acetylglucosamine--N-acetylmuramyl-(pentapeptide) pyrophosphoryl-undecaprenol N-acetylglucosamine transferase
LVPAIRLAQGVQKKREDCRILFVGGKRGLERKMVTAAGFDLVLISARGFVRRQPWKNLPVLWALFTSMLTCRRLVRQFNPDVAVGTGGYVTGPVIRAAYRAHVPTLIHEQNRQPGLTTRWLSRIADVACVAFEETASILAHPERAKTTGNPIDLVAIKQNRETAATELGMSPDCPTILVTGGSQGAQSINANIAEGLRQDGLPDGYQLIWQTGTRDYEPYKNFHAPDKGMVVQPFLDDLAGVMAAADLVIARAGALTIAEITARGLPAILAPYPFAAADHQTANARALAEAGAGVLVPDTELSQVDLLKRAAEILADSAAMKRMSECAKKLGRPEATEKIVDEIIRLAEQGRR